MTVKLECAQINIIDSFRSATQNEHEGTYELVGYSTQVSIVFPSINDVMLACFTNIVTSNNIN